MTSFKTNQSIMTQMPLSSFSTAAFQLKINRNPIQTEYDFLNSVLPNQDTQTTPNEATVPEKLANPECFYPWEHAKIVNPTV
jgi:hypothetical protein